jgi:hypothetical protein
MCEDLGQTMLEVGDIAKKNENSASLEISDRIAELKKELDALQEYYRDIKNYFEGSITLAELKAKHLSESQKSSLLESKRHDKEQTDFFRPRSSTDNIFLRKDDAAKKAIAVSNFKSRMHSASSDNHEIPASKSSIKEPSRYSLRKPDNVLRFSTHQEVKEEKEEMEHSEVFETKNRLVN